MVKFLHHPTYVPTILIQSARLYLLSFLYYWQQKRNKKFVNERYWWHWKISNLTRSYQHKYMYHSLTVTKQKKATLSRGWGYRAPNIRQHDYKLLKKFSKPPKNPKFSTVTHKINSMQNSIFKKLFKPSETNHLKCQLPGIHPIIMINATYLFTRLHRLKHRYHPRSHYYFVLACQIQNRQWQHNQLCKVTTLLSLWKTMTKSILQASLYVNNFNSIHFKLHANILLKS